MCSIVGALVWSASESKLAVSEQILTHIFERSYERGRDGRGFFSLYRDRATQQIKSHTYRSVARVDSLPEEYFFPPKKGLSAGVVIGNLRAEPTTEYVAVKHEYDQQPYGSGPWTIVHNGTIANDKELRYGNAMRFGPAVMTTIDSAAIVELLSTQDTSGLGLGELACYFESCIAKLKGSYAILATHSDHPEVMFVACNYRPIWYAQNEFGIFFASSSEYFPSTMRPQMVEPYSAWMFSVRGEVRLDTRKPLNKRALVVCSGGMDSVVAATWAVRNGYDTELIHFRYGSRAQAPELEAIMKVGAELGVATHLFDIPIYKASDSPLLQADSTIAGGEEGAEFAHEWVPARNLVMLSIATAIAESGGFDHLILGNNLEEAGAYPDNEPEFIKRFNEVLPFAVGDGKRMKVLMPVGNLMKHEIVALGHKLGAPLHLTWSCYRAGKKHCGKCGPCYMRKTAFAINGIPEVIEYEEG